MSQERAIYGLHPVAEALRATPEQIERILVAPGAADRLTDLLNHANAQGIAIEQVSRRQLEQVVGSVVHQGIVGVLAPFRYSTVAAMLKYAAAAPPLLLALDQVQDPHNLGSLTRSAFALGAHGIFFPKDRSCEVTAAVVKASAGATAHLPLAQVVNLGRALTQLKDAGLWVVGTSPEAEQRIDEIDLTGPIVIVVGSEGQGMRKMIKAACDFQARIPMPGTLGSLNAAVAGGICLYEAARQRVAKVCP